MAKLKEHPKYHVVSIRVSDEEKALLVEMSRRERTNITRVIRKAIYTSFMNVISNRG